MLSKDGLVGAIFRYENEKNYYWLQFQP